MTDSIVASPSLAGERILQAASYGELCAWTLARANARSGDRVALAAYLGGRDTFERALAEVAEGYADRTGSRFRQVQEAAERGAIVATTGA